MSNNYKDPELIRSYGDDIEQYFAEQILTKIPGYATFWATYIGILGENRLFAPFDPFYEQRHIALHGIKVPMRWADRRGSQSCPRCCCGRIRACG